MPKKPESRLQRRIRGVLEVEFPGSYWWKVHGGPFTPAGIPDLAGVVPWIVHTPSSDRLVVGRAVFLEVKRPGESASLVQRARMRHLMSAGAIVGVVTSPEEATTLVRSHLWRSNGSNE
jgi:hypothetical protein